jgi:DNA-binding protein H-NS
MSNSNEELNLTAIQAQIKELQSRAEEIITSQKQTVIESIRKLMTDYKLTLDEISPEVETTKAGRKVGTPKDKQAPAKYRGPNGESWSGRGLKPRWLVAEINAGKTKEDFLIEKVTS